MGLSIKRIIQNLNSILKYPTIHQTLAKKNTLYFFSFSWSFGGGERAFVDMLKLFKDHHPMCFITGNSVTSGFRKEFEAVSEVINLGRWSQKKIFKRHLLTKMSNAINAQEQPVVIGWSSAFMYELIPLLDNHVKIIDITHNFTDNGKGMELETLLYVPRIDKRIVGSTSVIKQFKELYRDNHIPSEYTSRLIFIQNKIPFDNFFPTKNYEANLQVVFVSRNSPEKRSDVLIKIAEMCLEAKLPVSFKIIGDYDPQKIKSPSNVEMVGIINDKNELNEHYKNSHLLLLTSEREGWGLVIFEAMNFGVVPISTDVGDLSNHISSQKENGIIIENLTDRKILAQLFKDEIERFCTERNLLKIFSKNAFETVKDLAENAEFEKTYRTVILGNSRVK